MALSADQIITGERLQALAEATVLTEPILRFHRSLPQAGIARTVLLPGTMDDLEPAAEGLAALRGARSVFVYTHLLDAFVAKVLPRLDHPVVLITHNSDHGVEERHRPLLDGGRIRHWFAQNARIAHPRLTPLPIGLANAQWPHGDTVALAAAASAGIARLDAVYASFAVHTNPAAREPLMRALRAKGFLNFPGPKPFADYARELAAYRWCVSPPGNGLDCHRTWEALCLGVVPVVQGGLSPGLYDGLPVIEMDDLAALSVEGLLADTRSLSGRALDPARLTMEHWRARVAAALDAPV